MESKSKKQPRKRITLVLRVDLIDRVLEKAKLLQQGSNNFVNLCVEGVLDAMDAPGSYDIPILSLHNQVEGKTFLTSKAVMAIVGALAPEVYEIDAQEQKFLMELVNKHEERLKAEVFKGYRRLAQRMNQERIAHAWELEALAPGDLIDVLTNAIDELIDIDLFNQEVQAEQVDAAKLVAIQEQCVAFFKSLRIA